MTGRTSILLGASVALILVTAVGAILALASLSAGGAVTVGSQPIFETAIGYDRTAERLLELDPPDLDAADRAARQALRLNPYDNGAWLRRTLIEAKRRGVLGPAGLSLLRNSYDLVPFDPVFGRWRVGFALEHWTELDPELRRAVKSEVDVIAGSSSRGRLIQTLRAVQDPSGRLTGALWAAGLLRRR